MDKINKYHADMLYWMNKFEKSNDFSDLEMVRFFNEALRDEVNRILIAEAKRKASWRD